jgi:hypothetical protein
VESERPEVAASLLFEGAANQGPFDAMKIEGRTYQEIPYTPVEI